MACSTASPAGCAAMAGEFELIASIFAPLAGEGAPAFGLRDDAASLTPPEGCDLVLTKDLMIAGRHFFDADPPERVARKLLRVNLSDLAASGAAPLGYLFGLAFPDRLDEELARALAAGLARDQAMFGCRLLGGDTVSGAGRLVLSLTAVGAVPVGTTLHRFGARPGDCVFVSGTIGDAALGLMMRRGEIAGHAGFGERLDLPTPRLELGAALRGIAHAAIDVSDGLAADLGHLCKESGTGARIEAARLPLSPEAADLLAATPDLLATILTGGDDYELLFTAPPSARPAVEAAARRSRTPVCEIGVMTSPHSVHILGPEGRPLTLARAGFEHP